MSEWRETTLGDFIDLQRGHDLPGTKRRSGNIPVIGSGGRTGWHDKPAASGPGITIGRAANLGIPTLTKEDFWPLNTTLYVTNFHGNSINFAYYLLRTLDLAGFNSGSVQPMLNRNYVKKFPLTVPERPEQDAIVEVIGALDDKIDINERVTNTALDLSEQHFLLATANASSSQELSKSAEWRSGGTPKTSEPTYWDGDIPWISASSLHSPWVNSSERNITESGLKSGSRQAPKGSIIFVVRGMSLKTEFRVGITQRDVAFGQDCKALIPHAEFDPHYLFHAIRSQRNSVLAIADEAGHGTGRLDTKVLGSLKIPLLPSNQADYLLTAVKSLDEESARREFESQTLAELRDTLLPKLVSGEIRVKDAEKQVSEAV